MTKRMFTIIFVTVGIALLCVSLFALVLFLAPGLSVFGLKYIRMDTHVVSKSVSISDMFAGTEFNRSIKLEVDDMPVFVEFSTEYFYKVDYYDNYSGITSSKFDDPSISITKGDDGTALIKVTSFKTFIFENGNSNRYVKLRIPAAIIGELQTYGGQTSLTILSDKSDITFSDEVSDNYNPYFNNITIETAGKVGLNTAVKTKTYSLKTINSINIDDDNSKQINATNYNLESTGGNIVVSRAVDGNIKATTNNASIKILSCSKLEASSGWGDIVCAKDDSKIKVDSVIINTTAGKVDIGEITSETDDSTITTKTGNVEIKKAYNLLVKTTRGHVNIVSAKNLNVETGSGKIYVEEATESIKAISKRGSITLGSSGTLFNPTVKTTYGNIIIHSASGDVSVETVEANVSFNNKDSANVKMSVGGSLTATKLKGITDITVSGTTILAYDVFSSDSKVKNNSSESTTISVLNSTINEFAYVLEGSSSVVAKYNIEENQYVTVASGSKISSGEAVIGKPKLTVNSSGSITVSCKYTAE